MNGVRCSLLRDTGATICAVRKRLVQPCQLLGSSIRCVSFGGREEEFPLAKVSVDSPYFSGEMTCCVLDAPIADFIVGNVPQVPSLISQDESCELTMQNSSAASQRNKNYKKTQDRKFSVGEEVLVLLPSASNKLLSSWLGPFPITKVFHPDYRVLVKGKESSMLTCSKDMFGVRRLQMLLLVVRSVFSLSGILSLGEKFHHY